MYSPQGEQVEHLPQASLCQREVWRDCKYDRNCEALPRESIYTQKHDTQHYQTHRVAHRTRTAVSSARANRNRLAGKLAECYVEQWNDETRFNRAIALHSILHSNIPPRYADKSAEPPQRVRVPLYAQKRPSTGRFRADKGTRTPTPLGIRS